MITPTESRAMAKIVNSLSPIQKADFYYYTIVENQDPTKVLANLGISDNNVIAKHGNHDQSTHGHRGFTADFVEDKSIQGTITYRSASRNMTIHMDSGITPKRRQEMLNTFAEMQDVAPIQDVTVEIVKGALDSGTAGSTQMHTGPKKIWLNATVLYGKGPEPEFLAIPPNVSTAKWGIAHEWGHAVDAAKTTDFSMVPEHSKIYDAAVESADHLGMKRYGMYSDIEFYAEAFADWHFSGGLGTMEATKQLAKIAGWNSLSETVLKTESKDDGFWVEDTFSLSSPPSRSRTVPDVSKSVTVKFPVEALPFIKHGTHDQSTHGRRGNKTSNPVGTPKNLNGTPTANLDGRQSWDDLVPSNDPQNDFIEMHCSLAGDRVENQGKRLMTKDEITEYAEGVIERAGYGKRGVATWAGEGVLEDNVVAGIGKGKTNLLVPDHPWHNRPVPVLCYRKEGITQFTVVHEMAHVLAGDWNGGLNDGGHSETFLDTFKQLAKQEGFTEGYNFLTFISGPQGDKSVFS